MAGKDIPVTGSALTADGAADGSLQMASTAGFRVGSRGNVSSSAVSGVEVIVTEITSATALKVRIVTPRALDVNIPPIGGKLNLQLNAISYGGSSLAAYTLAQGARFDCPRQLIYNEPV